MLAGVTWKILKLMDSSSNTIQNGWFLPPGISANTSLALPYTVTCAHPSRPPTGRALNTSTCMHPSWCMFDLTHDPCEEEDVATRYPDVFTHVYSRLQSYAQYAVGVNEGGCLPLIVEIPNMYNNGTSHAWQPCNSL